MLITTHTFPDPPDGSEVLDAMRTALGLLHVEDPMTVAHTLKAGVEALNVRGWTTGQLLAADGKVCAVGAIVTAAHAEDVVKESTSPAGLMAHPVVGPAVMALAAMTGYIENPDDAPWDRKMGRREDGTEYDRFIPALHWVTSWNDAVTDSYSWDEYEHLVTDFNSAVIPIQRTKAQRTQADVVDLFTKAIAVLEVL